MDIQSSTTGVDDFHRAVPSCSSHTLPQP
jgi:hypothetical protein